MRRFRSWLGLLVLVVAGLSACSGPLPATHASPATRGSAPPSAAVGDPQRCARLARRGFTPCPPTADRFQLPPTTIRNATSGAVPDATAHEWGRAFQLTEAYYRWALQANARSALTSGAFTDPSPQAIDNLFGSDLMELDAAAQAGGALEYEPPPIPITQVVLIPTDLQNAMQRQGLVRSQYGLAVKFTGPTRRAIRLPNGQEKVLVVRDANFVVTGLVWGNLQMDSDLGLIWYEHGIYGCDGSVRVACQL